MTETVQYITTMLARKRVIDDRNLQTNNMESYDRWVVDAVALLLIIELERQADIPRGFVGSAERGAG